MFGVVLAIILVVWLVGLLIFLLTFAVYQSSPKRIGYIPLPQRAVPTVAKTLMAGAGKGSVVFDLGCGDGRILAAALEAVPKATGVGIEYHPMVARLARWRLRRFGSRVRIARGDLLKHDLSSATHIFTYLNDVTMAQLEPKLQRELQPGTRLVSCDFRLPTKRPFQAIRIGSGRQLGQQLYLYKY